MLKRERRLANTDFGAIHYWQQGEGQPLLMLHQSTQSADEFDAFADAIAPHCRAIAVDLAGHGCSDEPDHELTVDEHAESLLAVLDDAGVGEANVLGHHGGGMVATALAAGHPDRVRRLVTSGAGLTAPEMRDRILNEPMSRDLPMDADGEFLQATWAIYRAMSARGASPESWFRPFSVSLRSRLRRYDLHRETMLFDYPSALGRVTQPTLMIRGEFDDYSGDIEGARELVTNSTAVTVEGCGAWQYIEQPVAMANVVRDFILSDVVDHKTTD